jgi:hypothetical protein
MKEKDHVKDDPVAHTEYLRIKKLLAKIGKDDALQEVIINRYCSLYSECLSTVTGIKRNAELAEECKERLGNREIEFETYAELTLKLDNQHVALDRLLQSKRDMMLKIEKECLMTTSSAMRAVPKTVKKEEDPHQGMFGT